MRREYYRVGDVVVCEHEDYSGVAKGDTRTVQGISRAEGTNNLIIKLWHPFNDLGYAWYLAKNFRNLAVRKEPEPMAGYQKTMYFAMNMIKGENNELIQMDVNKVTPYRDTKSAVIQDVKDLISEGDAWLVLQTVMLIEPKKVIPEIPLDITEYK